MISNPGIYDISLDAYHNAECCDAPSISSSGLVTLLDCPAKYWWGSPMNPKREPVDTAALAIGRAMHALFMEGETVFGERFAILPEGLTLAKTEGKDFAAKAKEDGKTLLRWADWLSVRSMTDALASHPLARAAFTDGAAEKTLAWKDEETGVWLRARPDWLPTDVERLFDYKTTTDAAHGPFSRAIASYGYHMKAAHVMAGCRALGIGVPKYFYFIAQEKTAPYLVALYALDRDAIEWGEVQNRAAIIKFARCLETNHWPGYSQQVEEIGLPIYYQRELQAKDLTGSQQQDATQ